MNEKDRGPDLRVVPGWNPLVGVPARTDAQIFDRAYVDSFDDEEALVRDVDEWAHEIGAPSIRWFVRSLGR